MWRDAAVRSNRPTPSTHNVYTFAVSTFPVARMFFQLRVVLVHTLTAPGKRQHHVVLSKVNLVLVFRSALEFRGQPVGMHFLVITGSRTIVPHLVGFKFNFLTINCAPHKTIFSADSLTFVRGRGVIN